ncbi:MAG TPA: hypothetical protein VJQ46_13545 [Gemmatimonadales bacterium]|nr:hypothetical protein [Gemmatimonadales bacterium]
MSERGELPPELQDLDRALRGVRFEPRPSLGPEIEGRVRRGEGGDDDRARHQRFLRAVWGLTASAVIAVLAGSAWLSHRPVEIDRCCFDLDGGGAADDGVTLLAERDAKVHHLRLYEDHDHSGTFSPGDLVRLERGDQPSIRANSSSGLVTTEHCCLDFDGGGHRDDVLLVVGVPPDRVVMAAIYERRPDRHGRRAADAFPLR